MGAQLRRDFGNVTRLRSRNVNNTPSDRLIQRSERTHADNSIDLSIGSINSKVRRTTLGPYGALRS